MPWSDNALILAVLAQIPGLGPITLLRLMANCGKPQDIWDAGKSAWLQAGASAACFQAHLQVDLELQIMQLRQDLRSHSTNLVTWLDSEYPASLREVISAPMALYYRGDYSLTQAKPCLAVVGTRRASQDGLTVTRNFCHALAGAGIVVVSGLARGIDGAAHKGTLAVQGKTIAVLGGGFAKIYPDEHKGLANAIMGAGGLLLSEYPPSHAAFPSQFKARNRIIAGLASGVLVIEAPRKSGALITADFALDQGREVFAVPGRIYEANWVGSNNLIKQGAHLVSEVEDIFSRLSSLDFRFSTGGVVPEFSKKEMAVFQAIVSGTNNLESLPGVAGVSWGEATFAVSNLQMGKYITVTVEGRILPGPLWSKALTGLQIEAGFL